MNDISPLNELNEREVKQPECEEVLEKMKVLEEDLNNFEKELAPLMAKLEALLKDTDAMIDTEKGKNVKAADDSMADLDNKLLDMAALKTSAMKKLVEYNKLIDEVKAKEATKDDSLNPILAKLSQEAKKIEE